MVANLIKLRWTLLVNSTKRSAWVLVGQLLGALYSLGLVALLAGGMVTIRTISQEFWELSFVLGGAAVILGWCVFPLVAFGVDSTLDPSRFATFAIPRRQLITGLAFSALIGIPGLVTVLGVGFAAFVWLPDVGVTVTAAGCAALAVVTCVAGSRALTTSLAPLLTSRRAREISAVIAMLPLMLIGPVLLTADRGANAGRDAIPGIVETVSWTPFGAVWAVPVDVAHGEWVRALAHGAIAIGTVVVAVVVWDHFLQRTLVSPLSSGAKDSKRRHGLGAFRTFVNTPTRAVAARCFTYWLRDVRYVTGLAAVPVVPVALFIMTGGSHTVLMYLLPSAVAFMVAWSISADLAYDSTAFWLHLAAGVSGWADRAGRVLSVFVLTLPILVVVTIGAAWYTGDWAGLPVSIGLTAGVLGTSLGIGSITSARFLYAVPKPGDSPFSTPQGSTMTNLIVQSVSWLVLLVLITPEVVLALLTLKAGWTAGVWLTFIVGVGMGALMLRQGMRIGARIYDDRGSELLTQLTKQG